MKRLLGTSSVQIVDWIADVFGKGPCFEPETLTVPSWTRKGVRAGREREQPANKKFAGCGFPVGLAVFWVWATKRRRYWRSWT